VSWLGIQHFYISSFWLQPRYCMFSSIRPLHSIFRTSLLFYSLCPTLMLFRSTLLCTTLIFCFPFQAMHSNNKSISTHVFSHWFFSTEINLDFYFQTLSDLNPRSDPLRSRGTYWCRGAAHKLKPILYPTSTSPTLHVASLSTSQPRPSSSVTTELI
jgi:hypothetical protein